MLNHYKLHALNIQHTKYKSNICHVPSPIQGSEGYLVDLPDMVPAHFRVSANSWESDTDRQATGIERGKGSARGRTECSDA